MIPVIKFGKIWKHRLRWVLIPVGIAQIGYGKTHQNPQYPNTSKTYPNDWCLVIIQVNNFPNLLIALNYFTLDLSKSINVDVDVRLDLHKYITEFFTRLG